MRKTIATLGIVGLGLMSATVSANATTPDNEKKITICHATSSVTNPFVSVTINLNALNGHTGAQHTPLDIVPVNDGDIMPQGQNLTAANLAILASGCAAVVVDPVVPPVDPDVPPVDPPVDPVDPVVPPVEETPGEATPEEDEEQEPAAPAAAAPAAAAPASAAAVVAPEAAAAAAKKTNVGYNVQTAVGQAADTGIPGWLMALTGILTAGAAMVVWQGARRTRSAER